MWDENISHSGWGFKKMFEQIPFSKLNIAKASDDAPPEAKLSATLDELVAELVASATPHHINPLRARRWLLTTGQRQALLAQYLTKKKEQTPMLDIAKLLEITEHGLNAQVSPREGESFAKAFTRKYETDESYRRQWQNHQDTKLMLSKTTATMTPTSTGSRQQQRR
jgi:hypothetical protein